MHIFGISVPRCHWLELRRESPRGLKKWFDDSRFLKIAESKSKSDF